VTVDVMLITDPRVVRVPIEERGDALVDLSDVGSLLLDLRKRDVNPDYSLVREGLANGLLTAQDRLSEGFALLVIEGYRPIELQARYFDEYCRRLRTLHPDWSDDVVSTSGSRYVSPPDIVPPHSTGGAIDLTLATNDGEELDMGTPVNASPEESQGACYTSAQGISGKAIRNRGLLIDTMGAAGFVNYPTEWWHWSYGDRYWAYLLGKPAAIFGAVLSSR
jgi:D-alanyl-D-alanine dipeptidase